MPSAELLTPELIQAFIQLIVERTGLKIRENDQKTFKEIILERAKLTGLDSVSVYYRLLIADTEQSNQEWGRLTTEITNTESFFFRDKGQFKLLKNHIFPELIRRKSKSKTIRVCSAGCSTGEEPYSIAMLLNELIPNFRDWDIIILGIDINMEAVKKAKAGVYRPWSFRGIDQDLQQRFFERTNEQYHISDDIKKIVRFQTGNLLDSSSLDPLSDIRDMDLILCRNVFIYFSNSAVKTVLNKFYNALSPSGYLLVGHAELYSQNPNKFWIKMFEESIAYQRPDHPSVAPTQTISSIALPRSPRLRTVDKDEGQPLDDSLVGTNIKMQKAALNLLRQLPADTRIAKFGNLTASELIQQFEQSLKEID